MAEFEAACRDLEIPLNVLPPRSPRLNGGVERINGSWRHEFYQAYDLPRQIHQLRSLIKSWQSIYNTIRPHQHLQLRTRRR